MPKTWMKATEFYNTDRDPLRGKRLGLRAKPANAVRDHILTLIDCDEIVKAMGANATKDDVLKANGCFKTVRIRTDLIGFISALRLRYQSHTDRDISIANVLSLLCLHGVYGLLELDEFQPVPA